MILWTLKLLNNARHAIAGRKNPHQLAWGVAFGMLLGIVPHGNLLAIVLLVLLLSLRVNHAVAGLTTIAVTLAAGFLDPMSHQVGEYFLANPGLRDAAAKAWLLPLVPWTDLNNTVVLGSFLIGVAALLPTFLAVFPFFFLLSKTVKDETASTSIQHERNDSIGVDPAHTQVPQPHFAKRPDQAHEVISSGDGAPESESKAVQPTETRIDVIRMSDHRSTEAVSADTPPSSQEPMDEALNYLLRQLRDSQPRNAA